MLTVRYYDESITARSMDNNAWADNELLIYDTFIRVYDNYLDTGWEGPDGDGSPTLLLMDWVDDNGEPVHNACYAGRQNGFQVFQFNRDDPDGECTDIIAHEFTHCLTGTLMTNNLYINEYGAINEAFSDICGNITEAMLHDTEDTTWLIQENGKETLRSMSEPRLYEQPAFVWDRYYVPPVRSSTNNNDSGGRPYQLISSEHGGLPSERGGNGASGPALLLDECGACHDPENRLCPAGGTASLEYGGGGLSGI